MLFQNSWVARAAGQRATVISNQRRHYCDFGAGEARHLGILDQVQAMLMMIVVSDVIADVVQQSGVEQESAVGFAEMVKLMGSVENAGRQVGDVVRMRGVVRVAPCYRKHR